MPSLAQGLAAIIASATSGECDPDTQLLTFPGFFFPVTADALTGGGEPAAFDFTHRVNTVPGKPPQFMMNARFVWTIYKMILDRHQLPPSADPQAGFAARFARAEAEMGDGLFTIAENTFYPVGAVPSDLHADTVWTKVALSGAAIVSAADDLSESEAKFMERFNTLAELGDQLVASITYERTTLVILRPWFDESKSILGERFWELPGIVISDGLDPPSGQMPAVVAKLVLIRNLRIHLPAQNLPVVGPGVIWRREEGEAPDAEGPSLTQLTAAELTPTMVAQPLRPDAGTVEHQVENSQDAAAKQLGLDTSGAPSGAQKFHVPLRFETSAAMTVTTDELARAQADRDSKASIVSETRARIASTAEEEARASNWPFPRKTQLGLELLSLRNGLRTAEVALAQAEQQLQRWQDAVKVLEQLAAIPEDPNPYVAALVCDRIPKCPNPDRTLFT